MYFCASHKEKSKWKLSDKWLFIRDIGMYIYGGFANTKRLVLQSQKLPKHLFIPGLKTLHQKGNRNYCTLLAQNNCRHPRSYVYICTYITFCVPYFATISFCCLIVHWLTFIDVMVFLTFSNDYTSWTSFVPCDCDPFSLLARERK